MASDDSIRIDVEYSQLLFEQYQKTFHLNSKSFKFDRDLSIDENLDRLAIFALQSNSTLAVYYSYKHIFLEIIARWILRTEELESKYKKEFGGFNGNDITGLSVLRAISSVVGASKQTSTLAELFLSRNNFFEILSERIESNVSISVDAIDSLLFSFYRLMSSNKERYVKFVTPKVLYSIIHQFGSSHQNTRYFAFELLTSYLNASEAIQNQFKENIIESHENCTFTYDDGSVIDLNFLHLVEAKRLSLFSSLTNPSYSSKGKRNYYEITSYSISNLLTLVSGILVPKAIIDSKEISSSKNDFVFTKNSMGVLNELAKSVQVGSPALLYGNAGSGKTFLINTIAKHMNYQDSLVKIHLGEQTDAKLLLGTYISGQKPGTFEWKSGVLTTAVREGRWVLIEDIDKAPTEILSVLLSLLENRELVIPSRGEVVKAGNGFQLISTIRTSNETKNNGIPDLIGKRLWNMIEVQLPNDSDITKILSTKFPLLGKMCISFIRMFKEVSKIFSSSSFITLNKASHPRVISVRDLINFCARCNQMLQDEGIVSGDLMLESHVYDNIFAEAVDCFASALTEKNALMSVVNTIGEVLEIPRSRVTLFLDNHVPQFLETDEMVKVGRAKLVKSTKDLFRQKKSVSATSFAKTNHSLRLMEQIGVSISMNEPVLLVGETGTGKTTIVQQLAKLMNKRLVVLNVSQQTDTSDLLGGFKPINAKILAVSLQETFENIFSATFSSKKNARFSETLSKCFNRNQWSNVIKLWREACKMAYQLLNKNDKLESEEEGGPKKKRKLGQLDKKLLLEKWNSFEDKVSEFKLHAQTMKSSFVFNFVEGALVKAVRDGDWLLLDEVNLASSDTLESIADLLSETVEERSILLAEKGDVESVRAHKEFRIFGCMNPSTDIGKKDLPMSIRSRFSEIYVHSPDRDLQDLMYIIEKYIGRYSVGDDWVINDVAELYLKAKSLAESNRIVDGANQNPHFSIRTLTRTLLYVGDIVTIYGLRRSLYEGFCMTFLTLLDINSENILRPLIFDFTLGKMKNPNSVMNQCPAPPSQSDSFVQFKHYWLKTGPLKPVPQPEYIITPFVEKNLLNLVRATSSKRFPILIQGPTSAGKTSMIKYLASITGHKCVRINNHEHTDLQEYLGTYISDSSGNLVFKEGILVEALKKGHWIILDELNLAPTDVLEALNRLLDDNRELFVPETQETVHPHPDFMLFATQNPPGIYGGRKILSRAFRNRFLELHFDDIPQSELEVILRDRCKIAPSYCKKIIDVYKELSIQRQSTRLFEQKNSFATLRDLFRWAMRDAIGYEELAMNGYMLLAERVRKRDEKELVKKCIEKVMRVKLDIEKYYESLEDEALKELPSNIVWTKSMRKLAVLVSTSIKYGEPLLLVGETGCGKTTICQLLAEYMKKQLIVINAHQNTETGDILGAQRPTRKRNDIRKRLFDRLTKFFSDSNIDLSEKERDLESMISKYRASKIDSNEENSLTEEIRNLIRENAILFEWKDGPLVEAMKKGDFFLLDEISLADDSVLERLNSVLETEKTLLLAEKGTDDSLIEAKTGFQFLATMNPGGDYGKKELSPALRNRFTEIWVPSMEDFDDVRKIVSSKLSPDAVVLVEPIVKFSQWFGNYIGGGSTNNGVISLRDILSWVQFINSSCDMIPLDASLLHGALMVFIDALGTNNTGFLGNSPSRLDQMREECFVKLEELSGMNIAGILKQTPDTSLNDTSLRCGLFQLARNTETKFNDFNLAAPTTALNAMKVVRAMQVKKPILLEGSPGVGKTSLVSALAKATGNNLIRINLSEQTDLVDLFGSDAPAEGGKTGEFVWRDAPFLRAMKNGEWVLLDEMNLASQSVLEGLNACLDHRGVAYIPELDKEFLCHNKFTVFAAQNPQIQGGGRKGLPKSFVNRFSVVYVDALKKNDLNAISNYLFPTIDTSISSKIIEFISALENEVVINKKWGFIGGPWEFNLRDTLRWLELLNSNQLSNDISAGDFLNMIACSRFRTRSDRENAKSLFESIFGYRPQEGNYFNLGEKFVQANSAMLGRDLLHQKTDCSNLKLLQCNVPYIEAAFRCIQLKIPLILTGPTFSGKTSLIRYLSSIIGVKLVEFSMNNDIDSMDILGGFEQVDLTKEVKEIAAELKEALLHIVLNDLSKGSSEGKRVLSALDFVGFISKTEFDSKNFSAFHQYFTAYMDSFPNSLLDDLFARSGRLIFKLNDTENVRFEWFDGLLVKAVQNGFWLVLDNANICNPAVLDRLNSLLETNGTLIINECSNEDGEPRVLRPHPNFRLFLTVNPKYGELSRAMRNRGIELFMEALPERMTNQDNLYFSNKWRSFDGNLEDGISNLDVNDSKYRPTSYYVPSDNSLVRSFGLLQDYVDMQNDSPSVEVISSIASFVSFATIPYLPKWKYTLDNCEIFQDQDRLESGLIVDTIKFLNNKFGLAYMSNLYEYASNKVTDMSGLDVNYSNYQTLHPFFNDSIKSLLPFNNLEDIYSEPSFLFIVIGAILQENEILNSIESRALNAKSNQLSYLELSAAYELGRDIKNVPQFPLYAFIRSIHKFMLTMVEESAAELFKWKGFFKSMYELHMIWICLMECSKTCDESKIKVVSDLLYDWISTIKQDGQLKEYGVRLESGLSHFKSKLTLTTGLSMGKIWERFRNIYPQSEKSWSEIMKLKELSLRFDELAQQQFHDSFALIRDLRQSVIETHNVILHNKVNDDHLTSLFDQLELGINQLSSISSNFSSTRNNGWKHEFQIVFTMIESYQISQKSTDNGQLIELATLSDKPTLSMINYNNSKTFNPFPRTFDSLFKDFNTGSSIVPDLFSDTIVESALLKADTLYSTPGKLLEQGREDMKIFSVEVTKNSNAMLTDKLNAYKKLLIEWIMEMVKAHVDEFNDEKSNINPFSNKGDIHYPELEILSEFIKTLNNNNFATIYEEFILPSLFILESTEDTRSLGKAWILFSCGAIQLYVPDSPYDPAIRDHVLYDKFKQQQQLSLDILKGWKTMRSILSSDDTTKIESDLENNLSSSPPESPRVYRPSRSVDTLFEEWKSFMDASIDTKPIMNLLNAAENLTDSGRKMLQIFQSNSSQFIERMRKNHFEFSDVNDILEGYIYGLKLGVELMSLDDLLVNDDNQMSKLSLVDVSQLVSRNALLEVFQKTKEFCKKLPLDNDLAERLMIYFLKINHTHNLDSDESTSKAILQDSLKMIYYRWTLRKMKHEEEEAAKASIFKYSDGDIDTEEDFRKLFPDYEDVMQVDDETHIKKLTFDDVYFILCESYMNTFLESTPNDLSDLVDSGARLVSEISSTNIKSSTINSSTLSVLIQKLGKSYKISGREQSDFNFYVESSPEEHRKAVTVVSSLQADLSSLLEQWPEHAVIQNINNACTELLMQSSNIPLARLIQKIEQIFTLLSEWEKYASSKVSLKANCDQIVNLIVTWRRLELSTWKSLFKNEERSIEANIGKWWFHLFESIIVPVTDCENEEISNTKLVSALSLFMGQGSLGEFKIRLRLLKAFLNHVMTFNTSESLKHSLANFISYIGQFEGPVQQKIFEVRKVLEKDISDVILFASWKDVNVDALKQSARKSHSNLYKVVKKYRALLATPVMPLIESGLSLESPVHDCPSKTTEFYYSSTDLRQEMKECEELSTWDSRPKTLKNILLLEQNIVSYRMRLENEEIPNLYAYSKELLQEMERLKKSTPKVYNDKDKKLIAALKTQKRKLLSDCLKDLRKSGLNSNTRADVHSCVESSTLIMCNSKSSKLSELEDVDIHFFKILDLFPRLKNAIANLAEDVPQVDAEKGLSIAENYIYSLIKMKEPIISLSEMVPRFSNLKKSVEAISSTEECHTLERATMRDTIESNLKTIKEICIWAPKLIDFSLTTLEATFTESSNSKCGIFYEAKELLFKLDTEYLTLDINVCDKSKIDFINRFKLFYEDFRKNLDNWSHNNNHLRFITEVLIGFFDNQNTDFNCYSSTSLAHVKGIEDVELSFRKLTSAILVAVQHVVKYQSEEIDTQEADWMINGQKKISNLVKALHYDSITRMLKETLECVSNVEYNSKTAKLSKAICAISMPIIERYFEMVIKVFEKSKMSYKESSHACFIFCTSLYNIATQGFCSPEGESEEKENDNLQDGTGLGDGEGSNANTNDIDEDDLNEKAQEPNDQENKEEDSNDEDDIEMEGDMAGKTEECSDQEEPNEDGDVSEEELDEERDEIDDLDPNAVDEKMWDEEVKDDTKNKDTENAPENSSNDDNMEAREDDEEAKPKDEKTDTNEDSNEDENDDDEVNDVGEQEDDVRNGEEEQLDENVDEAEALELPEDMALDDEGDEKEGESDDEQQVDDKIDDINENQDISDDDQNDEEQERDSEDMKDAIEEEKEEKAEGEENDVRSDGEEDGEENEISDMDDQEGEKEDPVDQDALSEEESVDDDSQLQEESNEGNDKSGVESQGQLGDDENLDMEASVKQESGTSGTGADNSAQEASEDLGGNGEERTSSEMNQEEDTSSSDSKRQMAKNSLKSLGDVMKEFHRRRQEIKEATQDEDAKEESSGARPDEFEHVNGENTDFDTQALGAANKDQIQSMNDDMAIDDDTEENNMTLEEDKHVDQEVIKEEEDQEPEENEDHAGDLDHDSKAQGMIPADQNVEIKEDPIDGEFTDYNNDLDSMDEDMDVEDENSVVTNEYPMSIEEARNIWINSDRQTQELSAGLCEQLRLILEPTLATKLKGDYKTGKRLNMKRIIPYIASDFRKDKIWLRRTKPSKRQYQIMIAVDDSKSMSESNSTSLAFNSIALVSKALTQLESGELSIVRFGEDIKLVHAFDQTFNAQESGPKIFQQFDFKQTRTNIRELCQKSLEIFEDARAKASTDLWQLQIILSDGVCEDHETILRLVRKAKEKKVMLVFVIIDGISTKESIMDMSQVSYVTDKDSGKVNLKVDKYLDTFPFEHYVIVKNINELPEMLSLILRQYFTEISSA